MILTDISENMLSIAKKKLRDSPLSDSIQIVVASVTKMDMLGDESFDFVLCEGDPLSYCEDPVKGVKELVHVARKGAYVVASVDNLYSHIVWSIRHGLLNS